MSLVDRGCIDPDFIAALLKAQTPGTHDWEQGKLFAKLKTPKYKKCKSDLEYFFSHILFGLSECWFWSGHVDELGYGRYSFGKNKTKAHRAAWNIFRGEIPKGKMILHHCDVRNCANPEHLYLGTQRDNMRDCSNRNRLNIKRFYGEESPVSKLTSLDVLAMRKIKDEKGLSYKKIAKEFGVTTMTAYRAITKQSWAKLI